MLRKLRADFNPEYLAAVFDPAGPTFRDEQAKNITSVKKFDAKTQTYVEHEYHGYKAQRAEMPADLRQQVPFIRQALNAYRIPILEQAGFEADDVIGTLSRKAAEQGYEVFVVSSDKDMMQLVNDKVCILNPPKDNLICNADKVEELLGVRPEQVIDVMALRGDSIDNIPGAPGIGDKGSVEIIKRFGTLENALDHSAEVEKKTYRESLQNNRDTILWSKKLVTIDQDVQIDLDLDQMVAGEPDNDALRKLFSELEFTTLLKELIPALEVKETDYRELKSAKELKAITGPKSTLAVAFDFVLTEKTTDEEAEVVEAAPASGDLPFTHQPSLLGMSEPDSPSSDSANSGGTSPQQLALALSSQAGKAFTRFDQWQRSFS